MLFVLDEDVSGAPPEQVLSQEPSKRRIQSWIFASETAPDHDCSCHGALNCLKCHETYVQMSLSLFYIIYICTLCELTCDCVIG